MDKNFPKPKKESIIYEDRFLYSCLASQPMAKSHVLIVWKKKVKDLHLLKRKEYEYLMDFVDSLRNSMLKTLKIEKVYLFYMDEAKHVHWHLIPRYNKKGFNVLEEKPKELKDFSLASKIKENLKW